MQHSTIKLTETQEVTMFQPITLTNAETGDKTVIEADRSVVLKLQDQDLLSDLEARGELAPHKTQEV